MAIAALVGLSLLSLWGLFYVKVFSSLQEHRAQHQLYAEFRSRQTLGTLSAAAHLPETAPVVSIGIPRLGIRHLIAVEGTSPGDLQLGPGHRPDTPLPGEEGTSYLLGRSSTFGGPFGRIGSLKKGDRISVATGEGDFSFTVDAVRRAGDPLSAFQQGAARLTLVTSEGTKRGARQVIYVDATLHGTAQSAPPGRPTTIAAADAQMRGDPGAWLPISLWLEATVIVLLILAWVGVRWGVVPTAIVAIPIVVAAFWGTAAAFTQLLPNLF